MENCGQGETVGAIVFHRRKPPTSITSVSRDSILESDHQNDQDEL
jgi:hypothetical protein